MRKVVSFDSKKTKCAAWLYLPDKEGPLPIVVMAHGLAGIKEMRLDAYAKRFSAAGYVCLVFDYRYFGASDGEPRQLLDFKKQHEDWNAAIAYSRQLPQVDNTKVILWGSSLSGGHVLKVASIHPEVVAVISQVPYLSAWASLRLSSLSKILALTLHGSYDLARGLLGLTPHYVLSIGEPDQLALLNGPGESESYLNLVPEGQSFDRRVSARCALNVMYSPIRVLNKLKMPILIQVGNNDQITPAKPAIEACKEIPNIILKRYDTGHFQPYVEPMFS
ncbi:MAG: alpha/beta hydrolase, partial [Methanosarcinaceae archaeon]|nr:alpha/beta hydrolase [Methanosarcinaceae archaeon]